MNISDIRALIKEIDNSSIQKFEYEYSGGKIFIGKNNENILVNENSNVNRNNEIKNVIADVNNKYKENTDEDCFYILSPIVGVFYSVPSPESEKFVNLGDKVTNGQTVCILEAMKMMNEIEAEESGVIIEILVENGEAVEYGQALFKVRRV